MAATTACADTEAQATHYQTLIITFHIPGDKLSSHKGMEMLEIQI